MRAYTDLQKSQGNFSENSRKDQNTFQESRNTDTQGPPYIIQGFLYGLKKNFGYVGYNLDGSLLNNRLFFYCACPHMCLILNICMPNFA